MARLPKIVTKTISGTKHEKMLLIVLVVALLIVLGLIIYFGSFAQSSARASTKNNISENEYLMHSPYQGIDDHSYEYQDNKSMVAIEYPVTGNKSIDEFLQDNINTQYDSFKESIENLSTTASAPYLERISFQVPFQNNKYLSIIISTFEDTHGAHPGSFSMYFTFDKETGKVITLNDITGANENIVLNAIRSDVIKQVTAQTPAIKDVIGGFVDDAVTADTVTNFAIDSENEIMFPFGRGQVAPESEGDITVTLQVKSIADALQNTLAKSIFVVPLNVNIPSPSVPPVISCNNCVALTFDDGPGPYTDTLLDTLEKYNIKATFFLVGSNVGRYSKEVAREFADGDTVANHTYTHPELTKLTDAQIKNEITKTSDAIKKVTGVDPIFIRPPYGSYDANVLNIFASYGLSGVLWNVDTRDWADRDSTIVCHRATTGIHAGDIILMHDIHPTTVAAVPCIIEGLESQGFTLVPLDTLLNGAKPGAIYRRGE